MALYVSCINTPDGNHYLIKDSQGRLVIANYYDFAATYAAGDYFVIQDDKEGFVFCKWVISSAAVAAGTDRKDFAGLLSNGYVVKTTVADELEAIKSSVAGSMHYIGVTSDKLTDGATVKTLTPASAGSLTKTTGFVAGDVVLAPCEEQVQKYHEFIFNGDIWSEFGMDRTFGALAGKNSAKGTVPDKNTWKEYVANDITVKEYSAGNKGYMKPISAVTSVSANGTISALTSATAETAKLHTTTIRGVGGSTTVVNSVTPTVKRLSTTSIKGVGGTTTAVATVDATTSKLVTGSALTSVNPTTSKLVTASINGVSGSTIASKVTIGSDTKKLASAGMAKSVVSGMAAAGSANGSDPFTNAVVTNECLSWNSRALNTTTVTPAVSADVAIPTVTADDVTVPVAADAITVATGSLSATGAGGSVATGVTTNTGSFATGALDAAGSGASIATGVTKTPVTVATAADSATTVATGSLSEKTATTNVGGEVVIAVERGTTSAATMAKDDTTVATGTVSTAGTGSSVATGVNTNSSSVLTGVKVASSEDVYAPCKASDTASNKVGFIDGITASDETKNITLVATDKDESCTHEITVS